MSRNIDGTCDSPWIKPGLPFLDSLLEEGELRVYRPGTVIYFQGEYSPGLLYVQKGSFKVSIYHEDGREKILGIQEAPTTFGEASAFDGEAYFCTAVALSQCHVYLFRNAVVAKLIRTYPEISFSIMESMSRKFRALALEVQELAFMDAPHRIAHLLTKLFADYGVLTTAGEKLSMPITHEELANMAGMSRVTVTTVLNRMQQQGIIEKKRRTIYILDKERLLILAQRNRRRGRPDGPLPQLKNHGAARPSLAGSRCPSYGDKASSWGSVIPEVAGPTAVQWNPIAGGPSARRRDTLSASSLRSSKRGGREFVDSFHECSVFNSKIISAVL